MTFQARRQSCPVTKCLVKLLPQQQNYNKLFSRSHQKSSQPLPIKFEVWCLQRRCCMRCKEPCKHAEHSQPVMRGWITGANWYWISISYRTCMHLLRCPMLVSGKTDLEVPEKCQQSHAGKEQVGGTVLIHLHIRNKHHAPQLQPPLVWGILRAGLQAGNAPGL